jgi:hypothetical protein
MAALLQFGYRVDAGTIAGQKINGQRDQRAMPLPCQTARADSLIQFNRRNKPANRRFLRKPTKTVEIVILAPDPTHACHICCIFFGE